MHIEDDRGPAADCVSEKSDDSHAHASAPPASEKSGDSRTHRIPESNGKGWYVKRDALTIQVERPHIDRSAIRAALTIREGSTIHYRNVVNLTSESARKKVLQELAAKGITIEETLLVEFEGVCREQPRSVGVACESPDFSGTPPLRLAGLSATFGKWLLLEDDDYLPIFVGAILAHRLKSDPVWLLIVAPPGGTKSELLRSLYDYSGIYALSKLTPRTLASGFGNRTDASLLSRLSTEILVLKDFTTVLEMGREQRQEVLSQLREIYDGRFDSAWGTGQELHWEGRLGFMAGVTPVIDRYTSAMAILGERFVLIRPHMAERDALSRRSLDGSGQEQTMRKELQRSMHVFLRSSGTFTPTVPKALLARFAALGDLIARGRSPVQRDSNRQLEYAPEPEAPTRLPKVLLSLARGIALAHDRHEVTEHELRLAGRVAIDCLPPLRRAALVALAKRETASLAQVIEVAAVRCSDTAMRRALEDLDALGVVQYAADSTTSEQRFALPARWVEVLRPQLASDGSERTEEARTVASARPPTNVSADIEALLKAGEMDEPERE